MEYNFMQPRLRIFVLGSRNKKEGNESSVIMVGRQIDPTLQLPCGKAFNALCKFRLIIGGTKVNRKMN